MNNNEQEITTKVNVIFSSLSYVYLALLVSEDHVVVR